MPEDDVVTTEAVTLLLDLVERDVTTVILEPTEPHARRVFERACGIVEAGAGR